MIVCEPTSGLTSRIFVIADAYDLARRTGRKLIIIWRKTSDCDCSYKMVFDMKQFSDVDVKVYECNQFDFKFSDIKSEPCLHSFLCSIREIGVRVLFFIKHTIVYRYYRNKCNIYKNSYIDNNELFDCNQAKGNNCYFEAYNCITGEGSISCVKFKDEFLTEADSLMNQHAEHCVGVHIRRTDHGPAKESSTTDKFIARMKHEIEIDPQICFYLATDDWSEQENLQKIFGDIIISQPGKVLNRSSSQGIRSSIIDILCLSQTKYILGSNQSMFSKFAADYGKIQLLIV